MLIEAKIDAYTKEQLMAMLKTGSPADKSEAIDRMADTNQLVRYPAERLEAYFTPERIRELSLEQEPDLYVPVTDKTVTVPIPRTTWNIQTLRRYIRTGYFPYGRRELYQDHFLTGLSPAGARRVTEDWRGVMEPTGRGIYRFKSTTLRHPLIGTVTLPKLTWRPEELAEYISKTWNWSYDVALTVVEEFRPKMVRTGAGTYRFKEIEAATPFGNFVMLYPLKARLGIFVSMGGKPKYEVKNKFEIFQTVPYEWDAEQEYKFMYEMLNLAAMVWTNGGFGLDDMLGVSDPAHAWHAPTPIQMDEALQTLNAEWLGDDYEYIEHANRDPEYPNFFSTEYFKKPEPDSTYQYFYIDHLKTRTVLRAQVPVDYEQLLQAYKIPMVYNGVKMEVVRP